MNEWSDHTPISFSISCNNVLVSDDDVYLSKYKWFMYKSNQIFRTALLESCKCHFKTNAFKCMK